jgi:hypothetical protein
VGAILPPPLQARQQQEIIQREDQPLPVEEDELSLAEGVDELDFPVGNDEDEDLVDPAADPVEEPDPNNDPINEPQPEPVEQEDPPQRKTRSGRVIKPNKRYHGDEWVTYQGTQKIKASALNKQFLNTLNWETTVSTLRSSEYKQMMALIDQKTDVDTGTVEWMHPMILAAKANSEDNPTWEQAMNGPDQAGYWEACEKELTTLTSKGSWEVVERQPWMNILPSTWAFKCKRFPDGMVRKLKARFCCRGDKQIEGVDYFDTFAPVVNWTTVRLMLVLSLILGLSTTQVDYTAAFVHALIDKDPDWDTLTEEERKTRGVYINMPRGFTERSSN